MTYEKTKGFARVVAQALEKQFPEVVVSRMQKSLRSGKVLVDWSQNDDKKTTVCVYSLRAKDRPTRFHPGDMAGGGKSTQEKGGKASDLRK